MEADFEKGSGKMDSRFEGNRWVLESKRTVVDVALDEIERRLKESGWSEDDIGIFPVAITEAITNAIVHGNLEIKKLQDESLDAYCARIVKAEENPVLTGKKVLVEIKISSEEAVISVTDEGNFMPQEKASAEVNDVDVYAYSGLGRGIMESACDNVEYSPGKVILYKKHSKK